LSGGHRPYSQVKKVGEQYMENEHPVLPFIADGLTSLIEVRHVTFGELGRISCGLRPVVVTASGRARYEQLCDRQGIPPYPTVVIDGAPDQ
jgi:hypothetical protein